MVLNIQCSSCYEGIGNDTVIYALKCGHICCHNCRVNWFGRQGRNTCPTCRHKQTEADLIRLYCDISEPGPSTPPSRDTVDEVCEKFAQHLATNNEHELIAQSASQLIDAVVGTSDSNSLRRPLHLLEAAIRELSLAFKDTQNDNRRLKASVDTAKSRHLTKTFFFREEIQRRDAVLLETEQRMKSSETQWRQQTMTIHQRLVEAEATVESQGTELHAKRQEVDSLRQSNLKWSKKYHALKQKTLQDKKRKKGDVDDSLIIV